MTTFEPTDKVLKVQEIRPVAEAMYFAGGEESAKKIIDWIKSYYGEARHVTEGPPIAPEYLAITSDKGMSSEVKFTVMPGKWVVYNNGYFERHETEDMNHFFNLITEDTDA